MRSLVGVVVFLFPTVVVGGDAKKSDGKKPDAKSPIPAGVYAMKGSDWSLKFDGSEKFEVFRSGKLLVVGKYKIEDKEITLSDEKGTAANRGTKKSGVYNFSVKGKNLSFKKVRDSSVNRPKILMRAAWVFQAEKKEEKK